MAQTEARSMELNALPVPRLPPTVLANEFTPELFASFRNRRPILIKGLLSSSGSDKWIGSDSSPGLIQQFWSASEMEIPIMRSIDGRTFADDDRLTYKESVPSSSILVQALLPELILDSDQPLTFHEGLGPQSSRLYYREVAPKSILNDLPLDIIQKTCLTESQDWINPSLVKAWVSSPGCVTPLHFDRCHGFLLQLVGKKYFMQFPREDSINVYPNNSPHLPYHISRVPYVTLLFGIDPRHGIPVSRYSMDIVEKLQWTINKFLRIKETNPYGVLLHPGDALYTPPGWFHEVTSISGSVSVTVPWDMNNTEYESIPPYMARGT